MNEIIWAVGGLAIGFLIAFLMFLLIEPFNRVNLLRTITKKNYGVIYLVGRGKQITTLIRNFDEDTIWVDNNVWVLEPTKIYRKDNKTNVNTIESKHIHVISGIPVLFLSLDSMKPLDFFSSQTDIKPEEIGASLRGWLYNQYAKMLFFKRTFELVGLLALFALIVIIYFSYTTNKSTQELLTISKDILNIVKNMTITR